MILGGDFAPLGMLLRDYGVDYNTIHVANAKGDVCKACGSLDHHD